MAANEATIEATEQSTKKQESVPSNPQSICSVCGKLVVTMWKFCGASAESLWVHMWEACGGAI